MNNFIQECNIAKNVSHSFTELHTSWQHVRTIAEDNLTIWHYVSVKAHEKDLCRQVTRYPLNNLIRHEGPHNTQ